MVMLDFLRSLPANGEKPRTKHASGANNHDISSRWRQSRGCKNFRKYVFSYMLVLEYETVPSGYFR